MSNPDRSAYEPSYEDEDIDSFDASDEEEEESSGRSPILIILGLLVLAGFGAVVWMAYETGKRQSARTETPTILAAEGPTKVAPDNPGGTKVANQDKIIYEQLSGTSPQQTSEQLLPPAEQPATRPAASVTTTPTTNLGAPGKPTSTTTGESASPSTTSPDIAAAVIPAGSAPSTTPSSTAKPAMTADAGQASTAAAPTSGAPSTAPSETSTLTAAKPATTTAAAAPATSAPTTPAKPARDNTQTATITPVDAAVVPPAMTRPTGSGSYVVQVGSYPNDAAAASAWQSIKGRNVTLLSSYKPDVVEVNLGAKGKWYRLRVGPFDSKEAAGDLCTRLKANGQDCIVAKP